MASIWSFKVWILCWSIFVCAIKPGRDTAWFRHSQLGRRTKKSKKMFSSVDITHLSPLTSTSYIDVLLSFKSVQKDVSKASIKVDLDTWNNFLENISFCGAWTFGPVGFLCSTIGLQDFCDGRVPRKRYKLKWEPLNKVPCLLMFRNIFPIIYKYTLERVRDI